MGVTNHLLTGIILQVGGGGSYFSSFAALFVGRFPFSLLFFKGVETTTYQLMVNWWFGARWFGVLGSPYERDWLLLNWSGWLKINLPKQRNQNKYHNSLSRIPWSRSLVKTKILDFPTVSIRNIQNWKFLMPSLVTCSLPPLGHHLTPRCQTGAQVRNIGKR